MATVNFNIPLLSIPFYYMLAVFPHGIAISRANKGDMQKHDNRNPRGSAYADSLKKRLSAKDYAAYERAEACHKNHFENMPLYIGTVLAAMIAEQRAGEDELGLLQYVIGWNVIRILYTINYINVETVTWSYLRSILYFMGLGWSFLMLYRSSIVLGN